MTASEKFVTSPILLRNSERGKGRIQFSTVEVKCPDHRLFLNISQTCLSCSVPSVSSATDEVAV